MYTHIVQPASSESGPSARKASASKVPAAARPARPLVRPSRAAERKFLATFGSFQAASAPMLQVNMHFATLFEIYEIMCLTFFEI